MKDYFSRIFAGLILAGLVAIALAAVAAPAHAQYMVSQSVGFGSGAVAVDPGCVGTTAVVGVPMTTYQQVAVPVAIPATVGYSQQVVGVPVGVGSCGGVGFSRGVGVRTGHFGGGFGVGNGFGGFNQSVGLPGGGINARKIKVKNVIRGRRFGF